MILKGRTSNSVKKQSKRQKKLAAKMEDKCPLCLDIFDPDDVNFFPCKCGYQICRFCWHRIRTNENGLCPHCRRQYPEDPATFKPLAPEELARLKNEKKKKEIQKKKEVAESRKQLANIRVVQKNLVFVHGLPVGIDTQEDKYRRLLQIFKDCGPVTKCVVNNKTNYAGSQVPRASVYVTFQKIEDALRAYKSLPSKIEDYEVKTSLGTTKYCSNFLKNVHCPKQDCMYLHETADEELCFTKEQIHAGEHLAFGDQLYDKMMSHFHSKYSQSKDPVIIEQEVEIHTQPKPNPVQVVKDAPSCQNMESNHSPHTSPQQSRLQPLFNRDSQNLAHESEESETRLEHCTSYEEYLNKFIGTRANSISSVQKSLTEESTVNNTHRTVKNSDVFIRPESRDVPQKDLWPDQRNSTTGQSNGLYNHQNTNSDFNILNGVETAAQFLNGISLNRTENGTSSSMYPNNESPEVHDDDLGFDPIAISMNALEDMIRNQPVGQRDVITSPSQWQQHQRNIVPTVSNLMRLRLIQTLQKRKNPPPGFAMNNTQSNQPPPSPAYDSRNNVLINRMSPVNVPNSYNPARTNFQVPRYQQSGVSLNGTMMNGYSTPPVRNFTPQPNPLAMQEMIARSIPTSQHIQSQSQAIPHSQYARVDPNLSPSFWNVNQSQQWMHAENSFQNQSMPDFVRPASPLLSVRRIQPQMRPDYSRQIQQAAARFNNPSPFPDTPQFIYPTPQQHNQQPKEVVHGFP